VTPAVHIRSVSKRFPGAPNTNRASTPTARLGATKKPLADGAPSGPGSDQSHDRKGVIFGKSAIPCGHGTSFDIAFAGTCEAS
jgi:hypothetical protein